MNQLKNQFKNLIGIFLIGWMVGCGGVGSPGLNLGLGGDSLTGDTVQNSDAGESGIGLEELDSGFVEGGPIDIPVTIAKLMPLKVLVSTDNGAIHMEGPPGTVEFDIPTPEVIILEISNDETGETVSASIQPDGSFEPVRLLGTELTLDLIALGEEEETIIETFGFEDQDGIQYVWSFENGDTLIGNYVPFDEEPPYVGDNHGHTIETNLVNMNSFQNFQPLDEPEDPAENDQMGEPEGPVSDDIQPAAESADEADDLDYGADHANDELL